MNDGLCMTIDELQSLILYIVDLIMWPMSGNTRLGVPNKESAE